MMRFAQRVLISRRLTHEEAERTMLEDAARGFWDPNLVSEFFAMLKKKEQAA